jgi:lipid-A-disaccharide synthase
MAAKVVVKIEHVGLVNILAGEGVVDEFIQGKAEPVAVSAALKEFLASSEKREALQLRFTEISSKLGGRGAHERAAQAVASWLQP